MALWIALFIVLICGASKEFRSVLIFGGIGAGVAYASPFIFHLILDPSALLWNQIPNPLPDWVAPVIIAACFCSLPLVAYIDHKAEQRRVEEFKKRVARN